MGLMNKFKNMFTEEIEDEPIKKEVIQVEIPAPAKVEKEERKEIIRKEITNDEMDLPIRREEPKEEIIPEKKEDKFTFPVFFDDKDFDTLEKPKKEPKIEKKVEPYSGGIEVPKEKPKVFKPTPVISPIFGVLDKNYTKEDITDRNEKKTVVRHEDHVMTIDDIRKKAYGTLEDDLESSLVRDDFYEAPTTSDEKDFFDDFGLLDDMSPEKEIDFIEEGPKTTRESRMAHITEETDIEEELNQSSQKIEEKKKRETDDLFDLIDSMYEKEDEE